jgi:hypothetical protein
VESSGDQAAEEEAAGKCLLQGLQPQTRQKVLRLAAASTWILFLDRTFRKSFRKFPEISPFPEFAVFTESRGS